MKSLDERLSSVTSPFEDNDQTQSEIIQIQYLQYRKDALLNAITKLNGRQEFDLYLEEVLSQLDSEDTILFINDCITKLNEIYPIDVLVDYIRTDNIIENTPDDVISLIKFFVYDEWVVSIVKYMPLLDINVLKDRASIFKVLKEAFYKTQEEIIKDEDIHPLIRYYFKYCPFTQGVKLLTVLIFKDIPGVVTEQLILNRNKEI
jgi:hypothetical protein